ncbi:MAG: hypothetical protein HYT71_00360 [Candidatus Aenigmarchaeota archaeon]|nr:hypothetical protein [Candidatus Aenigmarchaeota archaeon]
MVDEYPNPTPEEAAEWKEEKEHWKKKLIHIHNTVPIMDAEIRGTMTKDVQAATSIERLEMDKEFQKTVKTYNSTMMGFAVFNGVLSIVNVVFFLKLNGVI